MMVPSAKSSWFQSIDVIDAAARYFYKDVPSPENEVLRSISTCIYLARGISNYIAY